MFFVFAANADAVFLNNKGIFIDLAQLTAQMPKVPQSSLVTSLI